MDNKYLNRKMVGWLSYNPNYESRNSLYQNNNKVCYFYPRFLLQNGSYMPIDSKIDFPQVGRIAVWVQGGDDAESVANRYGNLVTATLNRSLECNYDSNNHYTARYNYDYGPKSSEIWLTATDDSAFYEVVESFQSIDNIINTHQVDMPADFMGTTKYILLTNHRKVIGPFAYTMHKNKLQLMGIASFDFMVGEYNADTIERDIIVVCDNQDKEAVKLLPIELLNSPSTCKAQFDLISNEDLLNHFLEQAKIKLDLNRKDFREIKDYITRIMKETNAIDFNNARLNRLQSILPKICDVQNHILDTFTNLMTSPEVSTIIVQELLKKYPTTLKESLASALGMSASGGAAVLTNQEGLNNEGGSSDAIMLPAAALPYNVINSFFVNQQIQNLVNTLSTASQNLAEKVDKVHEGNQIISKDDLQLEDLVSSPNFYPEYRDVISQELNVLYTCLDSLTSFIDQALGRNSSSGVNTSSPAANALNELSIKLSRSKDRLTKRISALDSDAKAEEIDLTLDQLDPKDDVSTDSKQIKCTLNDVLHNARLLTSHSMAFALIERNRLKKIYENVDTAHNLENQIADMTTRRDELTKSILDLETQCTERESALAHISENFKEMLEPYKDQYQAAAKLLENNLLQSFNPTAVLPMGINILNQAGANAQAGAAVMPQIATVSASTVAEGAAASNIITNYAALTANGLQNQVNANNLATQTNATVDDLGLDVDNYPQPIFNTNCLEDLSKFQSRKQILDQLSVFFNKHAARSISDNELANYLICITQSFITTFAGEPGTGKTSLCNLLARSLGLVREDQNNRFVEISVERGWTSVKDFIGYYNPLTKRMEKSNAEIFDAFYELNKEALALQAKGDQQYALTPEKLAPFFILLDEANLSPIEHYWAAFFRNCDDVSRQQRSISLGGRANWLLPENLRFLATINIDHTTEELSARFLDRSWVITLDPQKIDLDSPEANDDLLLKDKIVPFAALNKFFAPQKEDVIPKEIATMWQNIQDVFSSSDCAMPIRPRNLKMVHNYCLVASSCMNCHGEHGRLAPLDYAIAQKILPTINGNGDRYRILVEKLCELCQPELMPLSAKHLNRMQRNGGADLGFYQFFSR